MTFGTFRVEENVHAFLSPNGTRLGNSINWYRNIADVFTVTG
jgi:hypothetical protein